ncbi:unnamed protein product [Dibothriocephalus latus]|uniref:Uncharacterized protein n=1 Tax=Dibothriocephalus latus TaxID=60516 RepID=A0A3P6UKE8_DIBLA|nr:unnamed protein product [Dibothriocephalus latus]
MVAFDGHSAPPHPGSHRCTLTNGARDPDRFSLECIRVDSEREQTSFSTGTLLTDAINPNDAGSALSARPRRYTRSIDRARPPTPEPVVSDDSDYTDVSDLEEALRVAHF